MPVLIRVAGRLHMCICYTRVAYVCVCVCAYWESVLTLTTGGTWGHRAVAAPPLLGLNLGLLDLAAPDKDVITFSSL